jgi:hypothetical protein
VPRLILLAALLFAIAPAAQARFVHSDHVSLFSIINILEDETAGDIACAFCTLNIQGMSRATSPSSLAPSTSSPAGLSLATLPSSSGRFVLMRMLPFTAISPPSLATTEIASTAAVQGSRAVLPRGFALGVLLAPILILVGIVWLIVYLVHRNRYPYPAYMPQQQWGAQYD